MGQTTPNISIFIPAAGETNYDSSFSSGMVNVDQHDHTGAPTKGVPISTTGLVDGSVTYTKLNANVADTTTGIGVDGANPNKLQILGLLKQIYQLSPLANGELIIGSTGLSPAKAVPTAGSGITITPGAGSLAFAATFSVIARAPYVYTGVPQTYTPTVGMRFCTVEVVGGGGGGGGAANGANAAAGGGGGAGGYARQVFTAADIGASKTITIGAKGAGGAAGNNPGSSGGTTSINTTSVLQATGGTGGAGASSQASAAWPGGAGGVGSNGVINTTGAAGLSGFSYYIAGSISTCLGGQGAIGYLGSGSPIAVNTNSVGTGAAGNAATYYGAGGGGAVSLVNGGDKAGGDGYDGVCIITEYL